MFADRLKFWAWWNVALHFVGLAFAAWGMRPGTPLTPLAQRIAFLAEDPLGWKLGWFTWMLCAASLIAFLAEVVSRLPAHDRRAEVGLVVAMIGLAFDLLCDSLFIGLLPLAAQQGMTQPGLFLVVERMTGIGSLVIANGAYTVGILILVQRLRRHPGISPLATTLGWCVVFFGGAMALAGFTGVPEHAMWATPPTMFAFCTWVLLLSRELPPRRRA